MRESFESVIFYCVVILYYDAGKKEEKKIKLDSDTDKEAEHKVRPIASLNVRWHL